MGFFSLLLLGGTLSLNKRCVNVSIIWLRNEITTSSILYSNYCDYGEMSDIIFVCTSKISSKALFLLLSSYVFAQFLEDICQFFFFSFFS